MAVLKNVVLAASLLAPLALAAPLLDERALHTHTETFWVTVEETATVWVDPTDGAPVSTATSPAPAEVVAVTTTAAPAPVEVTPTTTTTEVPVVTPTPAVDSATAVAPAPAPSSSSTSSSEQPAAAVFAPQTVAAPASSPTTLATVAAAAPATTEAAPVASSSSATVAAAPQASATTSASSGSSSGSGSTSASASNTCEGEGDACVGDVTHWDGGLGACGWNVDTASELQVALPVGFMGSQSNGNPYCGRSITLYNPTSGTTVQAKVGDKCMGCVGRAIDCTDALFTSITDGTGDGRVSGIQWWLN
ncbi:hypothetical protein ABEF93_004420 [Exophiala dermatitidis]